MINRQIFCKLSPNYGLGRHEGQILVLVSILVSRLDLGLGLGGSVSFDITGGRDIAAVVLVATAATTPLATRNSRRPARPNVSSGPAGVATSSAIRMNLRCK